MRRKQTQSNYGEQTPRRHWGLGLLIGGLALFVVIALLAATLFHPYYYPVATPYYPGGWFFFPFGFIFFFFFIFFIGKLFFWPWGWGRGWRRGYYYRHDEAADILRQRYARGEITKDQFVQMMRDLERPG